MTLFHRRAADFRHARGLAVLTFAVLAGASVVLSGREAVILGTSAVVAFLVVGLYRWQWSVYGLLLYLPLSGIATVASYPDTAIAVLLKDILFVIPAYIGFALERLRLRGTLLPDTPINGFLVALVLLVLVEAFNPSVPDLLVAAVGIKVWLFYIPLLFLVLAMLESLAKLRLLLLALALGSIIPTSVGLLSAAFVYSGRADIVYALYGDAAQPVTQNFAQFDYVGTAFLRRIPSTFSFVTQYYYFTVSMLVITYAAWRSRLVGKGRWIAAVPFGLTLAAALLSGARVAFVAVPAVVLLMIVLEGRLRASSLGLALSPLLALALVTAALGTDLQAILQQAVDVASIEWTDLTHIDGPQAAAVGVLGLGTGFNTGATRFLTSPQDGYPEARGSRYESWYLKTFVELGAPGLVVLLSLATALAVAFWRVHTALASRELRSLSAGLMTFLLWILVTGIKASPIDVDPLNVYMWTFAAIMFRLPFLDSTW